MNERTIHDRRWWALAVLCLSLLVITLDNTILNVAIPALVKDLDATTSQLQWIIDGYTLVFAGLLLTIGSIGDRFGRKGALMVGLAIFGAGSMLSGLADAAPPADLHPGVDGHRRGADHAGHAVAAHQHLPRPAERGRAIGVWAAVAGASGALGPVHRRLPAAALLVGLGLLRQRARDHRRPRRRPVPAAVLA